MPSGGGGTMQLVASGAQDLFLTGNPQVTYFKTVFRRHTNFSTESIKQIWNGNSLTSDIEFKSTISKSGDLLQTLYLEQTLSVIQNVSHIADVFNGLSGVTVSGSISNTCFSNIKDNGGVFIYNPTHTAIDYVEFDIKGQCIDKQSGKWMEVYAQLNEPNSAGMLGCVGPNNGTRFQNMARGGGCVVNGIGGLVDKYSGGHSETIKNALVSIANNSGIIDCPIKTKFDAYVPLRFWFCKDIGSVIPLVCLDNSEVSVKMRFKKEALNNNNLDNYGSYISVEKNDLYAGYIFLDSDEKRRFYNSTHEYLIEQVQETVINNQRRNLDLNFSNNVKEIIWTAGQHNRTGLFGLLPGGSTDYQTNDYYRKGDKSESVNYKISMNGIDRMSARPLEYYTKQQVYDYHKGTPVGSGKSYVLLKEGGCEGYGLEYAISSSNSDTKVSVSGIYYEPGKSPWDAILNQIGPGQASNNTIAVYSFAIRPDEHQPSGTTNFSRLDNICLHIENAPIDAGDCCIEYDIYGVSYNILRIVSGFSSLGFGL